MAKKKVEFKVILKKHTIIDVATDEEVEKEVQKQADYMFYQSSDSCETEIVKVTDLE